MILEQVAGVQLLGQICDDVMCKQLEHSTRRVAEASYSTLQGVLVSVSYRQADLIIIGSGAVHGSRTDVVNTSGSSNRKYEPNSLASPHWSDQSVTPDVASSGQLVCYLRLSMHRAGGTRTGQGSYFWSSSSSVSAKGGRCVPEGPYLLEISAFKWTVIIIIQMP